MKLKARFAFGLAAAATFLCLAAPPAKAQGAISAADRAQRLAKLDEDLTSADQSVQLASFEQAVTAGTAAERVRAYAIGFGSSEGALRELALRYKICSLGFLNLQYNQVTHHMFDDVLTGGTAIALRDCNPASGTFTTIGPPEGSNRGYRDPLTGPFAKNHITPGGGAISGTTLQLSFKGGTLNVLLCDGTFELLPGKSVLIGRMACRRNAAGLAPIAVQIILG